MARTKLKPRHGARPDTTYEPLKVVLGEIETLHEEFRRVIDRVVPDESTDMRSDFLRSYEAALEQNRIRTIEDYCQEGEEMILETWVQYIPIDDLVESLRDIEANCASSTVDLTAGFIEFNQALVEFYRKLSRSASTEKIETMFSQLAQQTEREGVQLSWRMRDE